MNDLDAIAVAARLEQMGITVRSAHLADTAKQLTDFNQRGGNRAMRRAARRAQRRRGK